MSARGRYRLLFTPLRIGPVVVHNRIVFSAHLTNYAEGGHPTEQHAAYYAARAAAERASSSPRSTRHIPPIGRTRS